MAMVGLFGWADRGAEIAVDTVARTMRHVPGQWTDWRAGDGWLSGAVSAANGAGATFLPLGGGASVAVAGGPVLMGGRAASVSDFERLAREWSASGAVPVDWFAEVDGCFAFALIDPARRRALLANDRYGGVPIYTARVGGALRWGTEVKATAAGALGTGDVAADALSAFLADGYLAPSRTYFAAVQKIPARSALLIDLDTLATRACTVHAEETCRPAAPEPFEALVERFCALARQAVRDRVSAAAPRACASMRARSAPSAGALVHNELPGAPAGLGRPARTRIGHRHGLDAGHPGARSVFGQVRDRLRGGIGMFVARGC
jgi:hypothetical protein